MESDNSDVIITWKKHIKKCQQDANNMPKLAYFRKQGICRDFNIKHFTKTS